MPAMRLNARSKVNAPRRSPMAKAVAVTSIPAPPAKLAKVPLELEEPKEVPLNTWTSKKPLIVKVKSCERIVGPKATGETCHIVLETDNKAPFWEGQSYGVVPPGTKMNSKVRLYFFFSFSVSGE